jgi:hypothetical protein
VLRARDGKTIVDRAGATTESDDPLVPTLRRLMADFRSPYVPELPRFTGGAVGFLGYDTARWFEPVPLGREIDGPLRDSDDAGFMVFDTVLAFDHVQHRLLLIANARITGDEDLESLYQFACAKIEFLERRARARALRRTRAVGRSPSRLQSNLTREAFESAVRQAKEHIAAGDIYQVVLSQRFEAASRRPVHRLSRAAAREPVALHVLHPHGRPGHRRLVARDARAGRGAARRDASDRRARGRAGAASEEDLRLAEELKRNEKERAEHVMLVDLGRNDLGRVCEYGSVRVPQFMALERYSHVMHLVSIVEGKLADDAIGSTRWCPASRRAPCRGAEGARHGDHRGARAEPAGHLRRRGRLPRLRRQPRFLHHHPHDRHRGPASPTCRPAPASWPTRTRRRSTRRRATRRARSCGRWSSRKRGCDVVFVLDNYDSFTFNLVQYLGELGAEVQVRRNDQVTLDEIAGLRPSHIVIRRDPGGRRTRG